MYAPNNRAIRGLRYLQAAIRKLFTWIEAVHSAFVMGLVDDESFQPFDTYPFDETRPMDVSAETARGLELWERQVVHDHLADVNSIIVVAAGGARELVGLQELGHHVTGVEYGRLLCEASRKELTRRESSATIQWSERFNAPRDKGLYDAAFVARKFLSHVHGRRRRIELLTSIHQSLRPGATLVVAYYTRQSDTLAFRMQAALANALRWLCGRHNAPVEIGDHVDPESPLYHHHFVWDEVCDELREAGFMPIEHETTWFGWAVARRVSSPDERDAEYGSDD